MRVFFHQSLRKRFAKLQQYPHPKLRVRALDLIVLIAGILSPLMVIPQIIKIYSTHEAIGVSALSWGAFTVLDAPFIVYGIVHKERPIVITYVLFCAMNLAVTIGAIIYS
jgi:uncharacterized protein with PQ loop repeat